MENNEELPFIPYTIDQDEPLYRSLVKHHANTEKLLLKDAYASFLAEASDTAHNEKLLREAFPEFQPGYVVPEK